MHVHKSISTLLLSTTFLLSVTMYAYTLPGTEGDAQQAVQGFMYVAEGTVITDTQDQLHGQMVVVPLFESKAQQQLNQLKHKEQLSKNHLRQSHPIPTEDKPSSTARGEDRFSPDPLFIVSPLHYAQACFRGKATSVSVTSVPGSPKEAVLKLNTKLTELLYLYSNRALYNKRLAQRPVSSYSALLAHRTTNLPPPGQAP